jgi:hypothetical protein
MRRRTASWERKKTDYRNVCWPSRGMYSDIDRVELSERESRGAHITCFELLDTFQCLASSLKLCHIYDETLRNTYKFLTVHNKGIVERWS